MNPEELNKTLYDESSLTLDENSLVKYEDLGAVMQKKVPKGAIYFEGIVSDGEKNRNGYIIESTAWFKNKKFVKDFLKTGSILNNHVSAQPIGRPLSFELGDDGMVHVSGYVFDDVYTNGAIGRGLILGLSTGHVTHERLFMDEDTGEKLTEDEFWKLPWSEMSSKNWCVVVTNAEICEFSFVTVRSNRASTLVNEVAAHFNKGPTEVERLFLNHHNSMNDADKKTDTNGATPVDPNAKVETLTAEQIAEQNKAMTDENALLKTENESLKAKVADMEANHAAEIKKIQDENSAALVTAENAIRTKVKEELAAVVTAGNGVATDVKTPADFKKKYGKKR